MEISPFLLPPSIILNNWIFHANNYVLKYLLLTILLHSTYGIQQALAEFCANIQRCFDVFYGVWHKEEENISIQQQKSNSDTGWWGPTFSEIILPISSLPKTPTLCQPTSQGNFTQLQSLHSYWDTTPGQITVPVKHNIMSIIFCSNKKPTEDPVIPARDCLQNGYK